MKTKKLICLATFAAVAACALALTALGSAKNPIQKPLKIRSVNVWTIDLTSVDSSGVAPATVHVEGETTHCGRIIVDGSGLWDLSSPATPAGMYVSASGDGTVANRDRLTWELPGSAYLLEFTGGTGRFANVSGGFSPVAILDVAVTFPNPGTMVVTITATGEGTITY